MWADKDKHFPTEQTIDQRADDWNEPGNNLYGNFKQLYLLKQRHRHLKVSLSVGGWTWSTNFAGVAADPQKRARFVETAVKHVADLALDGIGKNGGSLVYHELYGLSKEGGNNRYRLGVSENAGGSILLCASAV